MSASGKNEIGVKRFVGILEQISYTDKATYPMAFIAIFISVNIGFIVAQAQTSIPFIVTSTFPTVIQTEPSPNSLAAGDERTDSLGIKQVWVPPTGSDCFMMGSTDQQVQDVYTQAKALGQAKLEWFIDESPQHKACFTQGYWLDEYDVTNTAFDAFIKADAYNNDDYWSVDGLKWKKENNIIGPDTMDTTCRVWPNNQVIPPRDSNNLQDPYLSQLQDPRVCVSWYEAEAYANWRTKTANDGIVYRLPTEAEWEYAARGPQSLIYPWGNTFDGTLLNYCDKSCRGQGASFDDNHPFTSPVDTYKKGRSWVNAYDMAGNAWQWVGDWYDANYYQNAPQNNPTGPTKGVFRVLRGGSWGDLPILTRSAYRFNSEPGNRISTVGFRLVGVAGAFKQ